MLFNSLHFAFYFPIVAGAYFFFPQRLRWMWLLAASYYFYMAWQPRYALLLLTSTSIVYVAALLMEGTTSKGRRRLFLLLGLSADLGILFFFKYYNFANETVRSISAYFSLPYHFPVSHLLLPVGISFYTFQTLAYSIDVYRGNIRAERHFGIFALFVSFFPQLVAGPIERAANLLPQFREQHTFDYARAADGLKLMAWGLFKKVVIADRVAVIVNYVYLHPQNHEGPGLALATLLFAWQIYCDFSGYSDIAIGAAQIMGFKLMVNFERPYWARSLPELWRRWHISLTSWFRDYVFMPLGGTRGSQARTALNVLLVFTITGLWHGAKWTFVIWGLAHGALLVMSMLTRGARQKAAGRLGITRFPRAHAVMQAGITFAMFYYAGVFFRATSVPDALYILKHLFMGWSEPFRGLGFKEFMHSIGFRTMEDLHIAVLAIILLETVHYLQSQGPLRPRIARLPVWFRWGLYYAIGAVIAYYGVFNESQFLYFQF